jgi:hypothetical protein
MGKLFDDIKDSGVHKGSKSQIASIMEVMSKEDRKDLLEALNDHSIPASNISRAMQKRGHKLGPHVISRYRRGEMVTKLDEFS